MSIVANAKRWEYNPALQRIAGVLEGALEKVGKKIQQELKAAYRHDAKSRFEGIMATAKDPKYNGFVGDSFRGYYHYIKFDQDAANKHWEKTRKSKDDYSGYPPNSISRWDDVRKWGKFIAVDYYHADESAKDAYERARNSFINKNMRKIENILGTRTTVTSTEVQFEFRAGVFEGSVRVNLGDEFFRAEVGLKYVLRRNPRVTPYFQYPLLFVEALIGGQKLGRLSEQELKEALEGVLK